MKRKVVLEVHIEEIDQGDWNSLLDDTAVQPGSTVRNTVLHVLETSTQLAESEVEVRIKKYMENYDV